MGSLLMGTESSSISDDTINTRVLPAECGESEDSEYCLQQFTEAADVRHGRSLARLCHQGIKVGQILTSQLGVSASSMGSNLFYLKEEVSETKLFFQHMSEVKPSGKGYVARGAVTSAKISKTISKILGKLVHMEGQRAVWWGLLYRGCTMRLKLVDLGGMMSLK